MLTFGILPKNIWENIMPDAAALSDLNLKPIGSGPYKFRSLLKNKDGDIKEYHLETNLDYYGQAPYLKNITFKFYINYQEAIKDLNDNQVDGLGYLPFEERANVLGADSLSFHELVRPRIVAIFFNREKNKALADKAARTALAQAIDKEQIIKDIFSGTYQPAAGPFLASSFVYNPNLKKYPFDPAAAADFFSRQPLSLSLTVVDSGLNVAVAEAVKQAWERAGTKVEIKIVSREQSLEMIKNRDFESLLYGESTGGDPDVYAFWHSSQNTARGLNLAGYSNAEVDKLLIEARQTTNREERIAKYQKFQEILTEEVPAIFLYSPVYTYLQSKKIKGFSGMVVISPADRFSGVADWYLKTKKKLVW
jgi:peptide/nickel transport system substrate-binding protein